MDFLIEYWLTAESDYPYTGTDDECMMYETEPFNDSGFQPVVTARYHVNGTSYTETDDESWQIDPTNAKIVLNT